MPFLVFAHIDPGDHVLVIEQELGQRLGKFGLADSGGTHEQERTDRPLLIGQARTAPADCIRNRLDSLFLAYDPLVKFILDTEQLLLLALEHLCHRDTRPLGHDFGDVLRGDRLGNDRILDGCLPCRKLVDSLLSLGQTPVSYFRNLAVVAGPLRSRSLNLVILHLLAGFLEPGQYILLVVPLLHQSFPDSQFVGQFLLNLLGLQGRSLSLDCLLLDFELADVAVQFCDRLRNRIHLQTQLGCSLIDQVDRFVRQETAGYVPVGQVHCRNQGVILDAHPVMVLVFLLQAPEDCY